jgi:16S rRNA (cytosine967-C5)-methyltransferase
MTETFTPRYPSARLLALHVLQECRQREAFVQEILDDHLRRADLGAADRGLATQLVYGVLRRRTTLDTLLRPFVSRPQHKVEPWIWDILRLGAFQMTLLTHIPVHAALYETVELAQQYGKPRAKGLINAVLRALAPLILEEWTSAPGPAALPVASAQYRELTRSLLPDPVTNPVEYLAAGFSWPTWLSQRWLERFGWEECLRLGFWFASPPAQWLRCNRLRGSREVVLRRLAEAGIRAQAGTFPEAIRLLENIPVRDLPGFAEGLLVVQDESAMRVVAALAPEPGSTVLDMCAAPGGKTTHLAECMNNQGRIVACDVDERRLENLADSCRRLGISIVEICPLGRDQEPPPGPFDAVLVDVPCSNTGVLARRPEARWRLTAQLLRRLVPLQVKLLSQACARARPGGVVVYATCSIEPEENRHVVNELLRTMPDMTLEADDEQIPGKPADGGYWARLRRQASQDRTVS